jgi:hypothetical protein
MGQGIARRLRWSSGMLATWRFLYHHAPQESKMTCHEGILRAVEWSYAQLGLISLLFAASVSGFHELTFRLDNNIPRAMK